MRQLLLLLGLPDLPLPEFLVFLGFAAGCALLLGWIADGILRGHGFGIIPNAVVLVGGAIFGAILWRRLGYVVIVDRQMATAIAAAAAGILALVAGGVAKRVI
ncbi:hypothetical protein FG93_03210 [Bosea sp. LC85]|uniref:hypothetical protein n=1 Tax=Bosea sp. LC85 TaxID=1502851 RepID=UPI0004E3D848|nr:hypothetical protein [Bosea sp. LC85]KFC69623.1 hypothetical protein FG93_03210 [Bosea sp. LC85]